MNISNTIKIKDDHEQAIIGLDSKLEKAEALRICTAVEFGIMIGEALNRCRIEKLLYESKIQALEEEIPKLKLRHINELENLVEGNQANIKMVVEKTKAIVDRLDVYKKTHTKYKFSEDIDLFYKQYNSLSKCSFDNLKTYSEYSKVVEKKIIISKEMTIIPLEVTLALQEAGPTTKVLIENKITICRDLESELYPLRATHQALIDRKEMMIDFHKKYLAEINRDKIKPKLKEIINLIKSTHRQTKNKALMTADIGIYSTDYYDDTEINYWHQKDKELAAEKMTFIHETMDALVSTVENL